LLGLKPPLKPLVWWQRLRIMCQAIEALIYLHTLCVWHRDFKADNIFLDEHLTAYLADTGFAKDQRPTSTAAKSKSNVIYMTKGYLDKTITDGGEYSAITDGYAVGITLLVCLTNRSVDGGLVERCEDEFEEDFEDIDPMKLADASGAWPLDVARTVRALAKSSDKCLCHEKKRKRAALLDVLQTLRSLIEPSDGVAPSPPGAEAPAAAASAAPPIAAAASPAPAAAAAASTGADAASAPMAPSPSPLSLQVRGMRPPTSSGSEEGSVKRNVSEAFSLFMALLDSHYAKGGLGGNAAPKDFHDRINHWASAGGIPEAVRSQMQARRRALSKAGTLECFMIGYAK